MRQVVSSKRFKVGGPKQAASSGLTVYPHSIVCGRRSSLMCKLETRPGCRFEVSTNTVGHRWDSSGLDLGYAPVFVRQVSAVGHRVGEGDGELADLISVPVEAFRFLAAMEDSGPL